LFGSPNDAVEAIKKAIDLNPTYEFQFRVYAWILYQSRKYDEAIQTLESFVETDSNSGSAYGDLWRVYSAKGDGEKAFAAFIRHREISKADPAVLDSFKTSYAQKGWPAVLLAFKEELKKDRPGEGYWPNYYALASVSAMTGDRELAFESLEQAIKYKSAWIPSIKVEPALDPLREDPRFADLLKRSVTEHDFAKPTFRVRRRFGLLIPQNSPSLCTCLVQFLHFIPQSAHNILFRGRSIRIDHVRIENDDRSLFVEVRNRRS
jgi:tetratricopeptide (TPR) repeat protein